jgi:hypothetical protein
MDKSLITKLVWLGALAAIPAAVLGLQKPHANVPVETRRVMTLDKPVAVEVSTGEVQGPAPLETAKPLDPPPKPTTMWVGGGKIKSKVHSAQAADAPAATTKPAAPATQAKDDRSAVPPKDPNSLTASVGSGSAACTQ